MGAPQIVTRTIKTKGARRPARQPRVPRTVLEEESFRNILCLERKRMERSQRMFLLMLLDVSRLVKEDRSGKSVRSLLRILSEAIRETDAIGWNKSGTTLGIIFTEIPAELRKSVAGILKTRVSGALYAALSFEQFGQVSISQHLCPEQWNHDARVRPSHPTLYPDLAARKRGRSFYSVSKRLMDIAFSAIGLLLLLPVLLAIALAVKLSSEGPVLFRQIRVGQYGTPFVFLKFRSMYTGNSAEVHRQYVRALILGKGEGANAGAADVIYKLTHDPRVTRLGAFLRKTSLDELPQLFNVLRGEMSLVGPRPAIPYEVEAYQRWHRRRVLEAKPGITGLWQVKGRSRVTFDEMVRLDVQYAATRSLWLDIKILAQTPAAVLLGSGAY